MFANDGDVIKKDEFLHFYHLRKSKDPGYYEFKPWDRASRLMHDYPSSLRNWKPNFFFVSGNGWEFVLGENLDDAPKFFRTWRILVSGASFSTVLLLFICTLLVTMICNMLVFCSSSMPLFEENIPCSC